MKKRSAEVRRMWNMQDLMLTMLIVLTLLLGVYKWNENALYRSI